jgi:hypothetical protein
MPLAIGLDHDILDIFWSFFQNSLKVSINDELIWI